MPLELKEDFHTFSESLHSQRNIYERKYFKTLLKK